MSAIPEGFCQCGCGKRTNLIRKTNRAYGHIKGQHYRYFGRHHHKEFATTEARFWAKVSIADAADCWEWQAHLNNRGYGQFNIGSNRLVLAHRFSYQLAHGDFPESLDVLHSCDNPKCVNHNHLFLGDAKMNVADMMAKGRARMVNPTFGSKNNLAKINEQIALQVKSLHAAGLKAAEIGKQLNLTYSIAYSICKGKTWKHVTPAE